MKRYTVEIRTAGAWEPIATFDSYAQAELFRFMYPDPNSVRISEVSAKQSRSVGLAH